MTSEMTGLTRINTIKKWLLSLTHMRKLSGWNLRLNECGNLSRFQYNLHIDKLIYATDYVDYVR
jgi:hypothetical protein